MRNLTLLVYSFVKSQIEINTCGQDSKSGLDDNISPFIPGPQ